MREATDVFVRKPVTGERRIRFALVGCGRISANHFEALEVHAETMNPLTAQYLNRLSDLLFIFCRLEVEPILWKPGGEATS